MSGVMSRRQAGEGIVNILRQWEVRNPSTRPGRAPEVFHVDGEDLVGRGRVTSSPMPRAELEEIYETVYKRLDRRRIHFSYGGYSAEAIAFAEAHQIALFEFDDRFRTKACSNDGRTLQKRPWTSLLPKGRELIALTVVAIVLAFVIFPQQAVIIAAIAVLVAVAVVWGWVQTGR